MENVLELKVVEGEGFEPSKAEPSDLQSDPFGHSGTPPRIQSRTFKLLLLKWWREKDSNLRRRSRQIYSLIPLATREPLLISGGNIMHSGFACKA